MKAAERKKWFGLVVIKLGEAPRDPFLCSLCKFFYPGHRDYESGVNDSWGCEHPIEKVRDINLDYCCFGSDCWAFRPKMTFAEETGGPVTPLVIKEAEEAAENYWREIGGRDS